jgi:hypothetical protein
MIGACEYEKKVTYAFERFYKKMCYLFIVFTE